jgi:hypothetical protein
MTDLSELRKMSNDQLIDRISELEVQLRKPHCRKHPEEEMVCAICRGSRGGKTTAKKYSSKQLSKWGKLGGRPRKPKDGDAA